MTVRNVSRQQMLALIAELDSDQADFSLATATSAELASNNINHAAGLQLRPGEFVPEHLTWDWLPNSAKSSGTGLVFIGENTGQGVLPLMAIAPPFPISDNSEFTDIKSTRGIVDVPASVLVVDLHVGKARIGIAQDARLVRSRTVSRYVRGQHRAGGQSANRFRRNRQEWQRKFDRKLADAVEKIASESEPAPVWLAIAGDRTAALRWLADTDVLTRTGIELLARSFDSRADDRSVLSKLARDVWACRVFEPSAI